MRDYEIVYIFRSNFTPEEIEAKLERYHGILTEGSGEITAVEQWGKRQLAYPIQKQTNGSYVVAQFTAEPDPLAELERVLKLEDDLLRYLVVLSEGELPIPESMREREGGESRPAEAKPESRPEGEGEPASAEAESAEAEGDEGAEAEGAEAEGDEGAEAEGDEGAEAEADTGAPSEDDDASADADEKEE